MARHATSRWLALACTGLLWGASSTADARPVSEKVTERVVTTAIDEALASLDTPENQIHIANILGSQHMRSAITGVTGSVVGGAIDGWMDAKKRHKIAFSSRDMRRAMQRDIAPGAATITRQVVDAAISGAMSQENAERAEAFAEAATRGAIRGLAHGIEFDLGPAMARTIRGQLGPSVGAMLRENVLPSVGSGLASDEMQLGIAHTTSTIASNIVRGADHAIDEVQDKSGDDKGGLQIFGDRVALGYMVALFFAFAFAILLVVVSVGLVRSNRRQRQIEQEGRTREQLLFDLLDGMGRDHPTIKTDMERLVREQLRNSEPGEPPKPPSAE